MGRTDEQKKRQNERRKQQRQQETEEQGAERRHKRTQADAAQRQLETDEQAVERRQAHTQVMAKSRGSQRQLETEEQAVERRQAHAEAVKNSSAAQRQLETDEQAVERRQAHTQVKANRRGAQRQVETDEQAVERRQAHTQVKAKSRGLQRRQETEEQAAERRRTHKLVMAESRRVQCQNETAAEKALRLEIAAVRRCRSRQEVLTGHDKAQYAALQGALDFAAYLEADGDPHFMEADGDPQPMETDGDPQPMETDSMGADGDQHLMGADATGADGEPHFMGADGEPHFMGADATDAGGGPLPMDIGADVAGGGATDVEPAPSNEPPSPAPLRASLDLGQMVLQGQVSKSNVQQILESIRSLSVDGESIPLSLLPETMAHIDRDLGKAAKHQYVGPEAISRRVCNSCGHGWPKVGISCCGNTLCTKNKKQKPKTMTATKWKLCEQLKAFVEDPQLAHHTLDHTATGLRSSSILNSKRYNFFRKTLDDVGGELEPRNMVLILHYDGFAPFAMAEQHSVGYLLVQVITHSAFRSKQVSVIPWFIFGGPDHLVSLQPFEEMMVADLKACFAGFECVWPTSVEVVYRGERFNLEPGAFTARAVLGLSVSDQPAAAMVGGWAFHGAFLSCRWGGKTCAGSKFDTKQVAARPFLIPKGKVKAGKTKKAEKGKAGATGAASVAGATGEGQLCGEPNAKSGATVWFCAPGQMEEQTASGHRDLEELLPKVDDINGQRNKTCTKDYVKELGWRRATFVWELYELYGFNPIIDMPPDFMHLSMGLLKDFLHIKVSTLAYVEKALAKASANASKGYPDFKSFFKTFRSTAGPVFTSARRFLRDLDHVTVSAASADEMHTYVRLIGDCVFKLLEPCKQHLGDVERAHVANVEAGWSMLRAVVCGFLDKRDKPVMGAWARGMEQRVLAYLQHIEGAKAGGVSTFSHGYRTFTSHLLQHLAKYCEEWGDAYEWWCFVFERFAGVLTKKLRGFNKNTGVDAHLGKCLSMEAAIWRHLGMEDGIRGGAPRCGHDCTANWAGGARSGEIVGKFTGVPARLSHVPAGAGDGATLFNAFTVFGVALTGGRTQKQVAASPWRRRLVAPAADKPRPLLAVLATSGAGVGQGLVKYHVDVVDALIVPEERPGDTELAGWGLTWGKPEFSAFRVDLPAALEPGVVQEVRLPCGEVDLTRQLAEQHQRVVLLIPKPAQAMGTDDMRIFFLVDPGPTFYMVEPTQHVFRDTRDCGWGSKRASKMSKLMDEELDGFSNEHICRAVAPVRGGVVHREVDSFSSNTDGLSDMEIAYVALAAQTKPNIEPYSKPGCISMLHRELSCPGFKMMWARVRDRYWGGDDDGKVFGDIGSGYGQVCMMAMLLTNCARSWGIENQESLHHAALTWKEEFCDENAFRKRHFDEHLQFVEGDISKLGPEAQQLISEADLIFCNNLLFGSMETKYKRCHGCRCLGWACRCR